MLDVEEEQRDVRATSPHTETEQSPHDRRKTATLIVIENR